jgi:phage shock protein PspC (stress-responsive transcriptional regulator)
MTPKRFTRTTRGRLIGGVCSGLGSYFNVDPLLFRIAFVGLSFFGGLGLGIYLFILLFVREEGAKRAPISAIWPRRTSWLGVLGIITLLIGVWLLLHSAAHWTLGEAGGLVAGAGTLLAIGVGAGYLWWRLAPERCQGGKADRKLFRILSFIVVVGVASIVLAAGSAWLAGTEGELAAWLVVAVGVALGVAAFAGRGRWLAVPAVAITLPVAVVAAADVDLHGGFGDETYRPDTLAELDDNYELGAGRLEVDLRDLDLPEGDTPLRLKVGAGEIVLLVRDEVCVATDARVGGGYVGALDREKGGLDVDWSEQPEAPSDVPRLVLDLDVGLGAAFVANRPFDDGHWDKGRGGFTPGEDGTNDACHEAAA